MKKLWLIGAMLVSMCTSTGLADGPTVSNVKAQQRYPWNALVDIDYTLSGDTSGLVPRTVDASVVTIGAVGIGSCRLLCWLNYWGRGDWKKRKALYAHRIKRLPRRHVYLHIYSLANLSGYVNRFDYKDRL